MHGQQYKTYLEWKRVGRQVRKGEHGQRDHLGETVFGLDQTDMIRSRRRVEQDYEDHRPARRPDVTTEFSFGPDDSDDYEEDELYRTAYDPNY